MGLFYMICSLVSLVGLESAFGAAGAKTWALEGFGAAGAISCSVGSAAPSSSLLCSLCWDLCILTILCFIFPWLPLPASLETNI